MTVWYVLVVGIEDAEDRKKLFYLIQRLNAVRSCIIFSLLLSKGLTASLLTDI